MSPKSPLGHNYEAQVAKILPESTLIYPSYMCRKSRLYVKVTIVFEVNRDLTKGFLATVFTYFLSCNLKVVIPMSLLYVIFVKTLRTVET